MYMDSPAVKKGTLQNKVRQSRAFIQWAENSCCTWMFLGVLLILKQSRCPVSEGINDNPTRDNYSELKRNMQWAHEKTRRNLKYRLLNERSQSEKAIYCKILTLWHSGKRKTMEMAKESVISRGWGRRRDEWVNHRGFVKAVKLLCMIL